jgi:hypothetical protein
MPRVGFEPTIPVFARKKMVYTLERADTVVDPAIPCYGHSIVLKNMALDELKSNEISISLTSWLVHFPSMKSQHKLFSHITVVYLDLWHLTRESSLLQTTGALCVNFNFGVIFYCTLHFLVS